MSSNYLSCKRVGPYIIKLYFLDDGSLIIDKHTSITLIPSDQFEIVRTVGCHYLSNLSGKEVYASLVDSPVVTESFPLVKNELSGSNKPLDAGNKTTE